ncbi:hypothetical protein [Sodalinema gerasimenkoae]|nr:hypothetical protein [Sodalinema gerasimenkoae]
MTALSHGVLILVCCTVDGQSTVLAMAIARATRITVPINLNVCTHS